MIALNLFLVVLLILATAFFVATEFAIIKIRPSRVDQMVIEGKRNALAVRKVTSNLDGYLSACQLGITVTALGLGWLGEPTFEKMLHPLFERLSFPEELVGIVSFLIAFLVITFLHVVLGELAPKTLAIQKAEAISILFAPVIIIFYKIMYPLIWVLNGSANRFIRLFGMKSAKEHEDAHTEEELRIIISESFESGHINQTELGYVNRIFAFDELIAREIMVPRIDMICLSSTNTYAENLAIIKEEQYTRFPIIQDSKDNIIGMINTKEFFLRTHDNPDFDVATLVHPILSVPESIQVNKLLKLMQLKEVHIAILVDEYGGTSGMITIEDILEEIVGEIRDEFDQEERLEIEVISENHIIVDGVATLTYIDELLHTDLADEQHDTIGGWLYSKNPELTKGMVVDHKDLTFKVLEQEKLRIRKVEIWRNEGTVEESYE
ncbi:MAG: rane protein [Paenibacillus sp.]|jgi:CBS domain containing-hemolysin-like protein|nr:rane protein [Paenibacillus sp.]